MNISAHKFEQCKINLYGYLRLHAEQSGTRLFAVNEKHTLTYAEALSKVDSIISNFFARGIKKGELVALRATRSLDVVLMVAALSAVGAVAVLTDAHFAVKQYIADSGVDIRPDWWLTNERGEGGISADGDWELQKEGEAAQPFRLDEFPVDREKVTAAAKNYDSEDPFLLIFTSGSTGKSKAVMLSHRAVIANPVDAMPLFEEDEKDVAIAILPLNHVFGFAVVACAIYCGHAMVFPPQIDVDTALSYIEKYRVSILYAVPTFFLNLLSEGKHKQHEISSLRLGLMAGGPFTEQQMEFIENELGLRLMPGYGMSECVGVSTMRYRDPVSLRAAGVGRRYPMTQIEILDEEGRVLPVGSEGEICVRGMTMMSGYYHGEEETRAVFDEEGRLHSEDLGYIDADGILHISGRKKDIIIRGGENFSAVKIERALLTLKEVYQAVAVGVPDEKLGEVPCAAVILRKNCHTDEESLKKRLASLLARNEVPVRILTVQAFPLTSSGKPDKNALKKYF